MRCSYHQSEWIVKKKLAAKELQVVHVRWKTNRFPLTKYSNLINF
jgi:hypothetical protein